MTADDALNYALLLLACALTFLGILGEGFDRNKKRPTLIGYCILIVVGATVLLGFVKYRKDIETHAADTATIATLGRSLADFQENAPKAIGEVCSASNDPRWSTVLDELQTLIRAESGPDAAPAPTAPTAPKTPPTPPPQAPADKAAQLWRRGYDAYLKSDTTSARKLYEQAIATDPSYAPAQNSLGRLAGDSHDPAEHAQEEAYYDKALAADPKYVPALNNLALVQLQEGNFDAAEGNARKVEAYRPGAGKALLDAVAAARKK